MKKHLSRTLMIGTIVVAALGACVAPALATILDDVQPPPWRGQFSTTSQYWLFERPDLTIQPDGSLGQPWLPSTHITVQPLGQWIQTDPNSPGRVGIWPLSGTPGTAGTMAITVDNHNPPNEVKYMWVQVVWQPQAGSVGEPILSGFNPAGTTPVAVPANLGGGWFETTYKWEIRPNPPDEFFVLSGNINVDQLIIDTWCIPEPSAGLLTLLGGGLLLVLRWRRQS